ncbi:MAG: glycosyltransferase family 2 protein [Bacteroidetes bacterium]|nr:glycosyltransferase family 2 protein [Bacteroidota bacterium]
MFTLKSLENLVKGLEDSGMKSNSNIVVIDDGSIDNTSEIIKEKFPEVDILKGNGNLWWTGSVNIGARYAFSTKKASFVLLWNNDIIAHKNYFHVVKRIMQANRTSVIFGSKIYSDYENRIIWSLGGIFNSKAVSFLWLDITPGRIW